MAEPAVAGDNRDDDDFASFLESEILSGAPDDDVVVVEAPEKRALKRLCTEEGTSQQNQSDMEIFNRVDATEKKASKKPRKEEGSSKQRQSDMGIFNKIPSELFHHIFKFLSSEDLIACALVCRFMSVAASDESLWRRLYCMRWGLGRQKGKLGGGAWKRLYIERDQEDMIEFVRDTPSEFREYYIQMQVAKRSQAPLLSQVQDDRIILDRTLADQVSIWKSSRGLTDEAVNGHVCSANTCSYKEIGDVFICEKTGCVHVCDDTCREVVMDHDSGCLVCTISGFCSDSWLSAEEDESAVFETDLQQAGVNDEAEPFMGSGRFARAYLLGYNCSDEKELKAALRYC